MKCNKVRDYLMNGYLDGEISELIRNRIEQHLYACKECQKLKNILVKQQNIFKNASHAKVPDEVWQRVEQRILEEDLNQNYSVLVRILDWLRLNFIPKPALAFITTAIVLIILVRTLGSGVFQEKQLAKDDSYLQELVTEYVINGNTVLYYGFGTAIEEYFL